MSDQTKVKMPISPVGRVSFASAFTPTAMEKDQTPKYSVTLLFPKKGMSPENIEAYKRMKAAAEKAAMDKFGVGLGGKVKGKEVYNPFRDGSEKEHLDGYGPDVMFVRFASMRQPAVVGPNKQPITIEDFYNGCEARVSYNVFAWEKPTKIGVSVGLINIQKTGEGEEFGAGRSNPDDDFDSIDGADDPESSIDDLMS